MSNIMVYLQFRVPHESTHCLLADLITEDNTKAQLHIKRMQETLRSAPCQNGDDLRQFYADLRVLSDRLLHAIAGYSSLHMIITNCDSLQLIGCGVVPREHYWFSLDNNEDLYKDDDEEQMNI